MHYRLAADLEDAPDATADRQGFAGGGMQGGTFGAAVDANDNAWLTSYGGKSITVFDKNGEPLTPPEGITFGGKLGLMQGIIVTPSGDVWSVGVEKNQLVFFPKGDLSKAKLLCEGDSAEPCKSFSSPFHLGIDQQDRIWATNAASDHVVRFPASDPSKVETFKVGYSPGGLAFDSQGNVWVTNHFGSGPRGLAKLIELALIQSAPMALSIQAHPLLAVGFPVRGPQSSMATIMSGSPTSRARKVQSWNCVASAPRTVHPASRPASRFLLPVVT